MFSFFSVNAFEMLFWTATTFLLVELIRTSEPATNGCGFRQGVAWNLERGTRRKTMSGRSPAG